MIDFFKNLFSNLWDAIASAFSWLGGLVSSIGGWIRDGFIYLMDLLWEFLVWLFESLARPLFETMLETCQEAVNWFFGLSFVPDEFIAINYFVDPAAIILSMVMSITILITISVTKFVIKLIPTIG